MRSSGVLFTQAEVLLWHLTRNAITTNVLKPLLGMRDPWAEDVRAANRRERWSSPVLLSLSSHIITLSFHHLIHLTVQSFRKKWTHGPKTSHLSSLKLRPAPPAHILTQKEHLLNLYAAQECENCCHISIKPEKLQSMWIYWLFLTGWWASKLKWRCRHLLGNMG